MERILDQLQKVSNWKQLLKISCKNNNISPMFAGQLTILRARVLAKKFSQKYQKIFKSEEQNIKNHLFWCQNELKTFNWLLITISALKKIKIVNFTQNQWNILTNIFKLKQRSILQYESVKLLNSKKKNSRAWSKQEQQLLIQILKQQNVNDTKWNQIGRNLYWKSSKIYFRTGKQCKQHWVNHLDPKKKHGSWTIQQDFQLIQLSQKLNRKWASIVKQFNDQRTEHMIKNRFKSLFMKHKKNNPQIKKQSKLIQSIKNQLINELYKQKHANKYNNILLNEDVKNNKLQIQIKEPIKIIKEQQIQLQVNQNQAKKNSTSNQSVNDVKTEQQINYIDSYSNIIEQNIQNQKNFNNEYRVYSPYCMSYPIGFSLTPTGLTPGQYFSPPAFFNNSFHHNMSMFQNILNNQQNSQSLNKKN